MPQLFSEFRVKDVTLKNRISVSPMCQYSAVDGCANEWHHVHLGAHAIGGAGLVHVEATAVSPEGRITPGCTGIWTDGHAEKFAPIVKFLKAQGAVPAIQIAHAGRKASANRPWEGDDHMKPDDPRAWQPIGPSPVAFGANLPRVPHEMTKADIARVRGDFVAAARRAHDVGFEWLELHFAHGYLAQSFFSPLANTRTDEYGGSFENRSRFLVETFSAVRKVWPQSLPLAVRLGVSDFQEGSQPLEESIELVRRFKSLGLDVIDVSLGFNTRTSPACRGDRLSWCRSPNACGARRRSRPRPAGSSPTPWRPTPSSARIAPTSSCWRTQCSPIPTGPITRPRRSTEKTRTRFCRRLMPTG